MLNVELWFWMSRSQGSAQRHGGCGSFPTAGACRRGAGCQSRTPFPPALDNQPAHLGTAYDAESSKKTRRWGRQLPRKPRAVTLQSSTWARAHHVALDPLPYACGLASFGAVRLVPPRHADINKVTCTNTVYIPRCHQLSPTPNMIAMSPLACPCPDIPVLVFLLGWATLALRCNQNEAQEVVLQLVRNEMSWWLEGLGGTSGLHSSYSSQVFY